MLLEDPEAIGRVHLDFLEAGADVITTATYQASVAGLAKRGLDPAEVRYQLELAVTLAANARDAFWAEPIHRSGRLCPLVAASIGPYGAYLADGSEYTGNYGIGSRELRTFHEQRWTILAAGPADLLACETLPCLPEAEALLELLAATPGRWAWFSFSCRSGTELCDGSPFAEAVKLCAGVGRVAGVGINCSAPEHLDELLDIGRNLTDLPLLAYPNSGESYDPGRKTWVTGGPQSSLADQAPGWLSRGARGIGGCCRIGPADIADLRGTLLG